MTHRERLLTAMAGEAPDRVACALSFYHVDLQRLAPPDTPLVDVADIHFVQRCPSAGATALAEYAADLPYDTRLGTEEQVRTYRRWEYHPEAPERRNPLAHARTLDDLRAFPFPEEDTGRAVEAQRAEVDALHGRGLAAGGNLPHLGGELFESAWRLRGLEAFLLDLVERPDWADYLLDRLTTLATANAKALAVAGVDVLALDDDVGMPGTMFISPTLWRRFFMPRMAEIIQAARAIEPDLCVLYHSDGTIEPILDGLVEIGVNALNPVQPEYMDAQTLRRRYGSRLALWGTVGRQTTFSFGSPEEIRREVQLRIETLGRAGLVLCPAYDIDEPDIPWRNIAAFLEAVRQYG